MLSSLPNFISLFSLYYWSRRSDKKRERFFHTQSSLALSIIGLILCSIFLYLHNLPLFVVSVTVYSIGFWAGESIFITHGVSSVVGSPAIGIALYNAIFTSGGWLGPYAIGLLRDHYHNHIGGIIVCAASVSLAMIGLLIMRYKYELNNNGVIEFVEMSDIRTGDEFTITDNDEEDEDDSVSVV